MVSFFLRKDIIFVSVTWKGNRIRVSTGEKINVKDWVEERRGSKIQRLNERVSGAAEVNSRLDQIEQRIKDLFAAKFKTKTYPTVEEVEDLLKRKEKVEQGVSFHQALDIFIQDSESGKRVTKSGQRITKGTIKNYKSFRKLIQDFEAKHFKITWSKVNDSLYDKLTSFMWDRGDFDNYVGQEVTIFKSFLNYSHKLGFIPSQLYTDKWIKWREDIDIVVFYPDELKTLMAIPVLDDTMTQARDIFIAGCITCLRVNNLLSLRVQQFTGDRLKVITAKTGDVLEIPVPPILVQIFVRNISTYNRLLPPMVEQTFNREVKRMAKHLSRHLKGKKIDGNDWSNYFQRTRRRQGKPVIEEVPMHEMISSHTMRRTGITNLLMAGLSDIEVKDISGHAINSAEFKRYIKISKQFISKKSNEAWDKVFKIG